MAEKQTIDAMWDDSPVDVSTEVNFIWSIANKLRGTYQSDKYKDVIIPMVIIRRFECALAPTKQKVVDQFKANPAYPAKAMYRVSGYQFYNTSEFDLAELVNDTDHLAANFKSYIQGFSANIQDIIKSLDFDKQIDKMDKNNRLLSVVKAFSELDLNPVTIDNVKMGYIFEDLIRRFSENAEAGDHYTGETVLWEEGIDVGRDIAYDLRGAGADVPIYLSERQALGRHAIGGLHHHLALSLLLGGREGRAVLRLDPLRLHE